MRSVLAVALLVSAGQAAACGSFATGRALLSVQYLGGEHVSLILDETLTGDFSTCHQPFIADWGFKTLTATLTSGDGQTFNALVQREPLGTPTPVPSAPTY
jgi:hypothetical protein